MKRIISIFLLAMLLLAACSRNDAPAGGSEPPPTMDQAQTETPATPYPPAQDQQADNLTPSAPETGSIPAGASLPYERPDWDSDFSADGFITLERFMWHVANAGYTFTMTSEQPLEFSNGHFVIHLEEWVSDMYWISARDLGGGNTRALPMSAFFVEGPSGTIGWGLAHELWDMFGITHLHTNFGNNLEAFATDRFNRQNRRLGRHRNAQEEHPNLQPSGIGVDNFPWDWFGRTISVETFNQTIAAENAHFVHTGHGLAWSNGYLTVEVRQDERGVGIAIFDGTGAILEVFDNTGAYAVIKGELSSGLAVSLWGTIAVCDRFTTMTPVFAEQSVSKTFLMFLVAARQH